MLNTLGSKIAAFGCVILFTGLAAGLLTGWGPRLIEDGHAAAAKKPNVLYCTQSKGFRHAVLHESEEVMEGLGPANGFNVTITQHAEEYFTPEKLKNLDVIIFYTTGELPLSDVQKAAFLNFIRSGKGFIGIHSATDTFYKWPEYGEMIGGYFDGHPWTQNDSVTLSATDRKSPLTKHWEESFTLTEEIYQFKEFQKDKVTVTMSMDPAKTDMTKKGIKAKEFPITWSRNFGQGRVFYTALGHRPEVWRDQRFQTMVVNAVKWAARDKAFE
ncbi:MAG TPA: ThuA domain-containing protein [Blastocatellia bacterium]|nr:ThuA domain-containing protein [Blastocatellia bacterium]